MTRRNTTASEWDEIVIRSLRPDDLERVIRVDAGITGRQRDEYFRGKLKQNLAETGIHVSLAAELDGRFVGFLLARVYYGEFGLPEPTAVLDTLAVDLGTQGQGVGEALVGQLRMQLSGLRVARLQTEVSWDNQALLSFFHRQGFHPAERFCLDLEIEQEP